MEIGEEISNGGEFRIYALGEGEVLKIPRFPRLMGLIFGNFRKKNEHDLIFLQQYFSDFIPDTEIINYKKGWAVRQKRVKGTLYSQRPAMTEQMWKLLIRAEKIYFETGFIPDISNPNNLFMEDGSDRLYIVDTSLLGRKKWWPIGYVVTGSLGTMLHKKIRRSLRTRCVFRQAVPR